MGKGLQYVGQLQQTNCKLKSREQVAHATLWDMNVRNTHKVMHKIITPLHECRSIGFGCNADEGDK